MRHVNRGENDPERLAVSAALDFYDRPNGTAIRANIINYVRM
jgi:hypothetical protein